MTPKKGRREDEGNCRPVSLTSGPGRVLEQIVVSGIARPREGNRGIRPSQRGFRKGRSCLSNVLFFEKCVTRLKAEGKVVDGVSLDLSKAFDSVSHSTGESWKRRQPRAWAGALFAGLRTVGMARPGESQ